jgi:hypothetical protein
MEEMKAVNTVDVLYIHISYRTMKSFAIVLGGSVRGMRRKDGGGT